MKVWLACAALVSTVMVGGCSSSSAPEPSGPASATSLTKMTSEEYFKAIAEVAPDISDDPLGSGDGDLSEFASEGYSDSYRFHVDVLRVQARGESTQVTFVITPADPGSFFGSAVLQSSDSVRTRNGSGIRSLVLVDPSSGTVFMPAVFNPSNPERPEAWSDCLCSYVPQSRSYSDASVAWKILMTAWMGPLPEGTETVTFRMAGVPDIIDLPVTWEQ